MQSFLEFLWPGSLWAASFPSTFLIYLFGCTLVFSRGLQWRSWTHDQWRWLVLGLILASSMVLNGPVLYRVQGLQVQQMSYFPLLIELVLLIVGLILVTQSSVKIVVVTVAIGYSFEHILADIVQIIGTLIFHANYGAYYANPLFKTAIFLFYVASSAIMWWVIGRKTIVNDDAIRDSRIWIIASLAVFAFVIFANGAGWGLGRVSPFANAGDVALRYGMLLFAYDAVCSIMVLVALLVVSSRNRLLHEVEVMHDINRRQQQHYEMSQEYRDVINMKMHDLKKIVANGGAINQEKSPRTVQSIDEAISSYDAIFHTGSSAIDAILNDKSLYCAKRGITLQCLVDGKALDFMEDADIYSLVGNIMDNAIEAVESITAKDMSRSITLNIAAQGNMVIIFETNQFEGALRARGDVLGTTKPGAHEHGFGMQSMRYVVDEYSGHMVFTAHNHIFELNIVLPLPA